MLYFLHRHTHTHGHVFCLSHCLSLSDGDTGEAFEGSCDLSHIHTHTEGEREPGWLQDPLQTSVLSLTCAALSDRAFTHAATATHTLHVHTPHVHPRIRTTEQPAKDSCHSNLLHAVHRSSSLSRDLWDCGFMTRTLYLFSCLSHCLGFF